MVVDGDSLAKLADRYLDDPALGDEIYRLNRDVLADPEVLPIGVELRIPDGRTADSTTAFPNAKGIEAVEADRAFRHGPRRMVAEIDRRRAAGTAAAPDSRRSTD